MGVIHQRTETDTEIIITFRYLWVFYYSLILAILIFFLGSKNGILNTLAMPLGLFGLMGMTVGVGSYKKVVDKHPERYMIKGHKLSIKNPFTIIIKK